MKLFSRLSEGRKMYDSVMAVFVLYGAFFILFEDYDRHFLQPFVEDSDWHLLVFSLFVMTLLGLLLHRYARRMDERISREQAAKENLLRRELTQNIAHELKTPVASILGFTDTILDNPDMSRETCRQFIQRTNAQAHRLTSLLQDLSTLNRMDYASSLLTVERVDVSHMVHGNTSLIYSIFRNLVNNVICYAGEGVTIDISAVQKHHYWHFTFSDNGCGIPEQHLSRLFERFYRVDKGRSRALGGTGLGLSIVKNAVLFHRGTISVCNNPGGGLCFHFTLHC